MLEYFILVTMTASFMTLAIIMFYRGFKTEMTFHLEEKLLHPSMLTIEKIYPLYEYIQSGRKNHKELNTTDKLYHIVRFLKKHLKTPDKSTFFVKIATQTNNPHLTPTQLATIINQTSKNSWSMLEEKIQTGLTFDQLVNTHNIPKEWATTLYK